MRTLLMLFLFCGVQSAFSQIDSSSVLLLKVDTFQWEFSFNEDVFEKGFSDIGHYYEKEFAHRNKGEINIKIDFPYKIDWGALYDEATFDEIKRIYSYRADSIHLKRILDTISFNDSKNWGYKNNIEVYINDKQQIVTGYKFIEIDNNSQAIYGYELYHHESGKSNEYWRREHEIPSISESSKENTLIVTHVFYAENSESRIKAIETNLVVK